mmetsp:Transcript_682/g.1902  ORF Transcript_682/g.1902 Transcript_682/m.1902 type:complete len:233 (-) Transcript_682:110-808(-)
MPSTLGASRSRLYHSKHFEAHPPTICAAWLDRELFQCYRQRKRLDDCGGLLHRLQRWLRQRSTELVCHLLPPGQFTCLHLHFCTQSTTARVHRFKLHRQGSTGPSICTSCSSGTIEFPDAGVGDYEDPVQLTPACVELDHNAVNLDRKTTSCRRRRPHHVYIVRNGRSNEQCKARAANSRAWRVAHACTSCSDVSKASTKSCATVVLPVSISILKLRVVAVANDNASGRPAW